MISHFRRSAVPAAAGGLFLAAVGYAVAFASNCPHSDEWHLLYDGLRRRFDVGWVMAHHNEHRYALAKGVWAAALHATDFDFRAPLVVSFGLLGGSVALLLAAVRRLAGRWAPADVFVPAVLLHWGHQFTWLMGFQVAFCLVVACAAGFVWAVGRATAGGERAAARLAAVFLVVMAFNGGFALGWCGPMGLWVAWVGWRTRSFGLLVVPVVVAAYLAFVVQTTPPPITRAARPDALGCVTAVLLYLGTGFGPAPQDAGGLVNGLTTAFAVGLTGLAAAAAGRAVVVNPGERVRAAGLLAALLGHLAVAASVAWYRGGAQGDRFVTPSAVGLAVAWVAVRRYVSWPRTANLAAAAAVGGYVLNLDPAYWQGVGLRTIQGTFLAAVDRGTPALFLTGQYGGQWHLTDTGGIYAALRDNRVGVFRRIPPDPPYATVPAGGPADLPPDVTFPDPPRPALGLRVRVEQTQSVGWQQVSLVWDSGRAAAHPPSVATHRHDLVFPTPPRPRNVRLEAASPSGELKVLAAEWLVEP